MTPEERLARLEQQMADTRDDLKEMRQDVRVIRDTLSEAKGGWKTLALIAGASGTLGALAVKFLPFLPLPR